MGGPLRVWEGGGDRAKFARGRWTLRLSACFARSVRTRAHGQRIAGGGGGEWGFMGEMEGATGRELCPGERDVAVRPCARGSST